jgi:hypothetical protein
MCCCVGFGIKNKQHLWLSIVSFSLNVGWFDSVLKWRIRRVCLLYHLCLLRLSLSVVWFHLSCIYCYLLMPCLLLALTRAMFKLRFKSTFFILLWESAIDVNVITNAAFYASIFIIYVSSCDSCLYLQEICMLQVSKGEKKLVVWVVQRRTGAKCVHVDM